MNIIRQCRYVGRYLRSTRGVAAMEYAIIVGVIVVGVGVAATAFQARITAFITDMTGRLDTAGTNIGTQENVGAPE